jgi:hypothetical protein
VHAQKRENLPGVPEGLAGGHIAVDCGNGPEVELGRSQGKGQGEGIVHPRIAIDDGWIGAFHPKSLIL